MPWERASLYCEPFGGMAGVLLIRPPVNTEIYNDRNGLVVNWWRVLRDHADDLHEALDRTPYSRLEWQRCVRRLRAVPAPLIDLDGPADVELARCFTVLVQQSVTSRSNPHDIADGEWKRQNTQRVRVAKRYTVVELAALQQRMRHVQLECRDAIQLLDELADVDHAVIYCDPPYADQRTLDLYACDVDRQTLAETLLRQRGRVAISGYGTEWDKLEWRRQEYRTSTGLNWAVTGAPSERIEVLWTNYEPLQLPLFA